MLILKVLADYRKGEVGMLLLKLETCKKHKLSFYAREWSIPTSEEEWNLTVFMWFSQLTLICMTVWGIEFVLGFDFLISTQLTESFSSTF